MRQREPEDTEHTQRWLVSYADFITLLFAFFVVMYSISQVNESKYKVLSDSMMKAFERNPELMEQDSMAAATDSPGLVAGPVDKGEGVIENAGASQEAISLPKADAPTEREKREFAQLFQRLDSVLKPLQEQRLVEIRANQDWIEIDVRSGLLFESGSDVLGKAADPLLQEIASQLSQSDNLMRIRGYTDNLAINTERFPSNWELSSARAVAVVRKLQGFGIDPERMAVEGFGEFNPIASNETAEGRARNRRVVLAISRFHSLTEQQPDTLHQAPATTQPAERRSEETESAVEVVRLPTGGLLIRGKDESNKQQNNDPQQNDDSQRP
ncbi:flagellar motor protein MotB [Permianibacter aggregans]|uniref:Chemotaxis protein MotB n=1 Tax=Permianibacter aggregans TaxID=1510150 RepID=A0A4R6UN71_9GAMM|nr:flagellar motor protein MotB [Permianibacter aggregans]QGX38256.1 flagellar motor protein MotD [Permianibacter aggregans]TDQ48570.1 chemotaxis protein MotB [Permianibacter aggregans]